MTKGNSTCCAFVTASLITKSHKLVASAFICLVTVPTLRGLSFTNCRIESSSDSTSGSCRYMRLSKADFANFSIKSFRRLVLDRP